MYLFGQETQRVEEETLRQDKGVGSILNVIKGSIRSPCGREDSQKMKQGVLLKQLYTALLISDQVY